MLDANACYQAMLARDPRFDGKFFVGVKTTGIYCRPICPARPLRRNVEFYPDRRSAERAGFRPCLRCRPEAAPLTPGWNGTSATVRRALKLIAEGALREDATDGAADEEAFAARVGLGARHLRRLFQDEVGATPKQISDAGRLNFARSLVRETSLSMTDVADAAGFASLRRFNDAFRKRFRKAPTALRATRKTSRETGSAAAGPYELSLEFRPPLDWPALVGHFRFHPLPAGLEKIEVDLYARAFRLGDSLGAIEVRPQLERERLKLRVWIDDPRHLQEIVRRTRRMFDLDSDPVLIAGGFAAYPLLAKLCKARPGLRLPRGWDPFETSVCSILGQLVSVPRAAQLVAQLVAAYGEEATHPATGAAIRLFPTPQVLAHASLAEVGATGARKAALREFASRVLDGRIGFSEAQDAESFKASILDVKGLGPWTAEYIALRALGDADAFPGTDLVLKRIVDMHPALDIAGLSPWRGYAAIHLWKEFAGQAPAPLPKAKPKGTK